MNPRHHLLLFCAGLAAALLACSDGGPSNGDSGPPGHQLRLEGPGPDVGLKPGQTRLLEVRYVRDDGKSVAGRQVSFAIYGDPRGTTLSGDRSTTNDSGIASIELRAGSAETAFEVRVTTADATLVVGVQISKAGFAALAVRPIYRGKLLQGSDLVRVDVRVHVGARCKTLAPADESSPLRERSLDGLGGQVVFAALPVAQAYTVAARASDAGKRLRAYGCIELPAQSLRESEQLQLEQPLDDAQPQLDGRYELVSELTLPATNRPLAAALAPWGNLRRCPNDPAQRLLDCILDALDPGDPLDCIITSPSPATQALISERGASNKGCTPEATATGGETIDRRLVSQMELHGKDLWAALVGLEAKGAATLRKLRLRSELTLAPLDAAQMTLATHRPLALSFEAKGAEVTYPFELVALPQPVAPAVGASVSGWTLTFSRHALGLRLGVLSRQAFGDLLLHLEGLPKTSVELVQTLAKLVEADHATGTKTGCEAIDLLACPAARLPVGCLLQACPAGLAAAAAQLDAGFVAIDDHPGADLELAGRTPLIDSGGTLRVDHLGGDPANAQAEHGRWTTATLRMANETIEAKQNSFTGHLIP